MFRKLMFPSLMLAMLAGWAIADQPATQRRVAVMPSTSGLESASERQEDWVGTASVDILNNGLVIVTKEAQVVIRNGRFVIIPEEVATFQLATARPTEDDLYTLISIPETDLDITWLGTDKDGQESVELSWTDSDDKSLDMPTRFAILTVMPLLESNIGKPTCSVTCGANGENPGSITCGTGKACIAYCRGGDPIVRCIPEPKEDPPEGPDGDPGQPGEQ